MTTILWSETDEIAQNAGDFTRRLSWDEALTLAKRILPDESHTITANLAESLRNKSVIDAMRLRQTGGR